MKPLDTLKVILLSLLTSSTISGLVVFWIKTRVELKMKLGFEKQLGHHKFELEKEMLDFKMKLELYKEFQSKNNEENFKIYKELISVVSKIRNHCKTAIEYFEAYKNEVDSFGNDSFLRNYHFLTLQKQSLRDFQSDFFRVVNENQIIISPRLGEHLESFIKIIPFIDRVISNVKEDDLKFNAEEHQYELRRWFNELNLNFEMILSNIQSSIDNKD